MCCHMSSVLAACSVILFCNVKGFEDIGVIVVKFCKYWNGLRVCITDVFLSLLVVLLCNILF